MRNILFFGTIAPLLLILVNKRPQPVTPSVTVADTRIIEGNSGQRTVEVMISISMASTAPVTVSYSTKNGNATVKTDYVQAEGSVTFNPGEVVKWVPVVIIGETQCEQDEKLEVELTTVTGASIARSTGSVTIVNDDCLPGPGMEPSIYDVKITYTGNTSLYGDPSNCQIRTNGFVVLTGLIWGDEKVAADDDIVYWGTLQMNMDIDICSVMRVNGEDQFCGMRAIGSGPVECDLKIYYDSRGGYIKIENKSGWFYRNITGGCDIAQMDEERPMIPNRTIASIFNGKDLPQLTERTLRVGKFVDDAGDGNITTFEVLRVIKKQ